MISIAEWACITIGIPGERQVLVALVPCPPSRCSARLASNIPAYSGVSGAPCVVPQGLLGSNEGCPAPPPPPPGMRTPIHWPLRFGYLASSNAEALPNGAHSIAATAIAASKLRSDIVVGLAPTGIRCCIKILPCVASCRYKVRCARQRRPGSPYSALGRANVQMAQWLALAPRLERRQSSAS